MRSRLLVAGSSLAVAVVTALLAGGCGAGDGGRAGADAEPAAVRTPGPGFVDPSSSPAPEATITPRPGSWDGVHLPEGYRVVLLTEGDDAPTRVLTEAVRDWAKEEGADLTTLTTPAGLVPRISKALDLAPDLVVSVGNDLIDPLALVSANHLDQQFLVLGAELPEPTENVTAADWPGAAFRGAGLNMSSKYDAKTFTPQRAGRAVRAGAAAVVNGLTGIVVQVS